MCGPNLYVNPLVKLDMFCSRLLCSRGACRLGTTIISPLDAKHGGLMIAPAPLHYEGQCRNVGRGVRFKSVFLPFAGAPIAFISFSLSGVRTQALKRSQVDESERMWYRVWSDSHRLKFWGNVFTWESLSFRAFISNVCVTVGFSYSLVCRPEEISFTLSVCVSVSMNSVWAVCMYDKCSGILGHP